MDKDNYIDDIKAIKNLMAKSSRFISLSGLSGIMAGVYALIGALTCRWLVNTYSYGTLFLDGWVFKTCVIILISVATLSCITGILLTTKKAKKNNEPIWNITTQRLLVSFAIPLVVGGLYCMIILSQGRYGQTGGLMLIFYGLALINASKHSISDIKYLGFIQLILGLLASYQPGYGFMLWTFGFGIMHIVYGTWMHFKYDTK